MSVLSLWTVWSYFPDAGKWRKWLQVLGKVLFTVAAGLEFCLNGFFFVSSGRNVSPFIVLQGFRGVRFLLKL